MQRSFRAVVVTSVAAVLAATVTVGPAVAEPSPFGLACTVIDEAVRHCPGDGADERVPSFDGIPIDADVTLPLSGDGPWPTIVMINGLGGDKSQLQNNVDTEPSTTVDPVPPNTTRYDSIYYAQHGYAVVNISTRGFGRSCGSGEFGLGVLGGAKTQLPPCTDGFVRVSDARYEARDVQHLLGLLADQGISSSTATGATGFSYGGGIAALVGALNDRVMCDGNDHSRDGFTDPCAGEDDGALIGWTSPDGTDMSMGAIYGQWLWTDLIGSVLPNGRFLDFDDSTIHTQLDPIGVYAKSYIDALLGLADTRGFVQTTGVGDPEWDLEGIVAQLNAGEPYDAIVGSIGQEYVDRHGALGIPGQASPMLLEAGFTDDLFPAREPLKMYNELHTREASPDVVLLLGDYGHSRSANRATVAEAFNDLAFEFFNSRLKGEGSGPAAGSVTVYETTCPAFGDDAVQDAGPYIADAWDQISDDVLSFGGADAQTVRNPGGDPLIGQNFDPIAQTNPAFGTIDPCKTIAAPTWPDTTVALYDHEVAEDALMIGLPTIRATIATTGLFGQLNGRLFEVDADGNHRLITRGTYRLEDNQSGELVMQLLGNAYTFTAGNTIRLELAPSDHPQYRQADDPFQVEVTDLTIELPLVAASALPGAGDGGTVDDDDDAAVDDDTTDVGDDLAATGGGALVLALGALAGASAIRRRREA